MEDLVAGDILAQLPTLKDMARIFPVTFHSVGLFLLGYYVGRGSNTRYIDFLEKRKD